MSDGEIESESIQVSPDLAQQGRRDLPLAGGYDFQNEGSSIYFSWNKSILGLSIIMLVLSSGTSKTYSSPISKDSVWAHTYLINTLTALEWNVYKTTRDSSSAFRALEMRTQFAFEDSKRRGQDISFVEFEIPKLAKKLNFENVFTAFIHSSEKESFALEKEYYQVETNDHCKKPASQPRPLLELFSQFPAGWVCEAFHAKPDPRKLVALEFVHPQLSSFNVFKILKVTRFVEIRNFPEALRYLYLLQQSEPVYRYAYELTQKIYQALAKGDGSVALSR